MTRLEITKEISEDLECSYGLTTQKLSRVLSDFMKREVEVSIVEVSGPREGTIDIQVNCSPNLLSYSIWIVKQDGKYIQQMLAYEEPIPNPETYLNTFTPVLTQENMALAESGECEFVPVIKKATVVGLELNRRCMCMCSSKAVCNHCEHEQSYSNQHCVKCGQPKALWNNKS